MLRTYVGLSSKCASRRRIAPNLMASPGAVLAIDHGTRRTGFAVADALRITSEPLTTFHGAGDGNDLIDFIAGLMADRQVTVFVVGQPLNMDGSVGPRAKDVGEFCARLSARFPGPELALVDERLSTKEAESRLVEAGHTGQDRKDRRDSWSAMILLEDWLRAE
jgi:putative Holliday junction resolvase